MCSHGVKIIRINNRVQSIENAIPIETVARHRDTEEKEQQ